MPAPQSTSSSPGGEAGRVRCLYCGANNFPASPACWQCSRPLKAMPEAPPAPSTTGSSAGPAFLPGMAPAASARPALRESPLAPKAAVAMGLLFPLIGLPAGMIFLMLDDPRKTYLGWLMIGWSIGGTVLSVVPLLLTLGPFLTLLHGLAPHPGSPPPSLPGLPTDGGGDGLRLLFACLLYRF